MAETLLWGAAGGAVYRPESVLDCVGSAEPDLRPMMVTKAYAPQGAGGDAMLRRLHATARYGAEVGLTAAVIVDGKRIGDQAAFLHRAGGDGRAAWSVPLVARGGSVQVEIRAEPARDEWFLEEMQLGMQQGSTFRRTL
jgi:hypothetical protein